MNSTAVGKTTIMALALVLLTLPAGLAGQSGRSAGATPPRDTHAVAPPSRIQVHVKNDGWLDISVYAVVSGSPSYLGRVTGLSEGTFYVPDDWQATGDVRLLADPLGGFGHYLTEPLRLSPGDMVDLRVADDLRFSTYSLRPAPPSE